MRKGYRLRKMHMGYYIRKFALSSTLWLDISYYLTQIYNIWYILHCYLRFSFRWSVTQQVLTLLLLQYKRSVRAFVSTLIPIIMEIVFYPPVSEASRGVY